MKSFTPTEASYNLGGGAEKSFTFPTFVIYYLFRKVLKTWRD